MRKILVGALSVLLVGCLTLPSGAAVKMTRLGEDPAGDGTPTLDVTYLDVGRAGDALEIRIGMATILPVVRAIPPEAPGVEWIFDVKGRTFVAEGVPGTTPTFYLFELMDDGSATQLETPQGTYDAEDGYVMLMIPLKTIGAKKGTVISGTGPKGTEDVDAHIHFGVADEYPDRMATTKDFVVR
jgi:hypothetical protein